MSQKRGAPGGPAAKKPRQEEEEEGGNFEEHLAGLMEEEEEWGEEVTAVVGEGPRQEATRARWTRPAPPPTDPAKDNLVFQQVKLLGHLDGCMALWMVYGCLDGLLALFGS